MKYFAIMFLFDVSEECCIAEICFGARAFIIPRFDGDAELIFFV